MQPNILANSENWVVTHLNNDEELRILSRYYDFADFSQSLKRAQDVGFARIKTLSSPFVVPTQIDRFEPVRIREMLRAILRSDQRLAGEQGPRSDRMQPPPAPELPWH